jgi:L-Ala-D/L-Glu epimerase / N-acetyl-D-glutamate racemase
VIRFSRVAIETWPLAGTFRISRGAKTAAEVVVVALTDGHVFGRGEATPYAHYGETPDGVRRQVLRSAGLLSRSPGASRRRLLAGMPAGAARNALDCALWDLEAKQRRRPVAQLAGLARLRPALTCYTLSLDTPDAMAAAARAASELPLLKLKLGAPGDADRMTAVRASRPDARLVVDANEGWAAADLEQLAEVAAACRVELIEQPLPAGDDELLGRLDLPVAVCADEAAHPGADLGALRPRYDAVNIKLDKAGGLTHAIALMRQAERCGLDVMLGSMVGTSLAMAAAVHLSPFARWVDLDSPLLLAKDRTAAMKVRNGWLWPPSRQLWG